MNRPRLKRSSPLPLAAISIALLLLPSSFSQKPRLVASSLLLPPRWSAGLARSAADSLLRLAPHSPHEDRLRLEHALARQQELETLVARQKDSIDNLSGARSLLKDPALRLLPAHVVVAADSNAWRRSMIISAGSSHGVAKGMLVLWEKQLVGRVAETSPFLSRVTLVTDSAFRVGAVALPRSRPETTSFQPRDLGVLEGTGDRLAVLKWLAGDAPVEEGATVITTPDPAQGVPAGLILGRVASVSRGRGLYPRVDVAPFLNYRALDSVVVLLGSP